MSSKLTALLFTRYIQVDNTIFDNEYILRIDHVDGIKYNTSPRFYLQFITTFADNINSIYHGNWPRHGLRWSGLYCYSGTVRVGSLSIIQRKKTKYYTATIMSMSRQAETSLASNAIVMMKASIETASELSIWRHNSYGLIYEWRHNIFDHLSLAKRLTLMACRLIFGIVNILISSAIESHEITKI